MTVCHAANERLMETHHYEEIVKFVDTYLRRRVEQSLEAAWQGRGTQLHDMEVILVDATAGMLNSFQRASEVYFAQEGIVSATHIDDIIDRLRQHRALSSVRIAVDFRLKADCEADVVPILDSETLQEYFPNVPFILSSEDKTSLEDRLEQVFTRIQDHGYAQPDEVSTL